MNPVEPGRFNNLVHMRSSVSSRTCESFALSLADPSLRMQPDPAQSHEWANVKYEFQLVKECNVRKLEAVLVTPRDPLLCCS